MICDLLSVVAYFALSTVVVELCFILFLFFNYKFDTLQDTGSRI